MSTLDFSGSLFAWMLQTIMVALTAALLPILFRVRHPRIQLHYCHGALALCFLLPFVEPWRTEPMPDGVAHIVRSAVPGAWLLAILASGIVLQLCWMSRALWRIRRYRIGATPLYPIPEAMRAASAITHADALFCLSEDAAGPMMLGWLAPVVLLPSAFMSLDEEAQCGIACHELLHVRRGDWLVTLLEEFTRALLWFNPGVWLLLSEARLARELLVDAESVRLTASRETYIDALLSIARGRVWQELVPAPSFLRRGHLTQRMQSLLSDRPVSGLYTTGSYCVIAAIVGCSIWLTASLFPLMAQPSAVASRPQLPAPVPSIRAVVPSPAPGLSATRAADAMVSTPVRAASMSPVMDPWEPVTGGVRVASNATERAAAVSLFTRASVTSLRHARGTPPYRFDVSFVASGKVRDTGQGELSETWMTGQKWRWTVGLGSFSHTRLSFRGQLLEDRHATVVPMRAHTLRNEIFWGVHRIPNDARIRTAPSSWHGKPATCVLSSDGPVIQADDEELQTQGRLWGEEEHCFDDASGVLVVHSIAPGTYAHFEYDAVQSFHGWPIPTRIKTYVAGALVSDAAIDIADATVTDDASLTPSPGMTSMPAPVELGSYFHSRIDSPGGPGADPSQPVIVHAEVDSDGDVVETELSGTANTALVPAALGMVSKMHFGHTGTERQAYIDVRFVPPVR